MSTLSKKIDFAILISVENANPNGDPLCGNRPREDYDGYGEISDVCLKRKIRNRLIDMNEPVFPVRREANGSQQMTLTCHHTLKHLPALSRMHNLQYHVD
mgnify:CR=1 FL=1